jgi:hypothetical protein
MLLLPIVVKNFDQVAAARYVIYLIPLFSIALAGLLISIFDSVQGANLLAAPSPLNRLSSTSTSLLRHGGMLVIVVMILFLALGSVFVLRGTFSRLYAEGRTNAEYFRLLELLRSENACGRRLVVEDMTTFSTRWPQQWYTVNSIHYLLTLESCNHRLIKLNGLRQAAELKRADWLIITGQAASRLADLIEPVTTVAAYPDLQPAPVILFHNKLASTDK